jgi:hypothetical protein
MINEGMQVEELRDLPAAVDMATAARALTVSYEAGRVLAARGEFPCPVFKAGGQWRVPRSGLLALLGIDAARDGPGAA